MPHGQFCQFLCPNSRLRQVFCQYGRSRSVAGAAALTAAGVRDVRVLEGGIEAYAAVDSTVPKYAKYTPNFKF